MPTIIERYGSAAMRSMSLFAASFTGATRAAASPWMSMSVFLLSLRGEQH
jgi:hypothetical protein